MNLHLGLHNHRVCFYENILVNITAATSHGISALKGPFKITQISNTPRKFGI